MSTTALIDGNKELSARWFAVQAKTTHEKRVGALLSQRGLESFLPLYQARRRWSDRVKEVDLPLFPGYIFCRFVSEERMPILTTPSVLGIAGIGKEPLPIDDDEIEAIRRVVESGLGLAPEPFLEKRRRVRINAGSLEGLEGMIQDVRHKHQLILSVTLLQRSIAVDIDRAWVTVLPKSGREKACSPPLWASASYCRS